MLAELRRGGERHEDLVLPAVGRDLGDLDEPAARVLLDVEVEPLALQHEGARGQVAGPAPAAAPVAPAPVLGTGLRPRHVVVAQPPLSSAGRGDGGKVPELDEGENLLINYRVTLMVEDLGLVDFELDVPSS